MDENTLKISAEELDYVEGIIHQVMASLPDLGFRASHARFPYSLHHDYYRTRLRIHGRRLRHEEVAIILNQWASKQEKPADTYVWQAISGAIRNLQGREKINLPDYIRQGMESVAHGETFEAWAKAFLKEAATEEA